MVVHLRQTGLWLLHVQRASRFARSRKPLASQTRSRCIIANAEIADGQTRW